MSLSPRSRSSSSPGNLTATRPGSSASSRSSRGALPPRKLKDSCDMCSSSKVKCNKEKPICSRCQNLNYPCFYSPARRIGRPHASRQRSTPKASSSEPSPPCASCRTSDDHKEEKGNNEGDGNVLDGPHSYSQTRSSALEERADQIWPSNKDGVNLNALYGLEDGYRSLTGPIDSIKVAPDPTMTAARDACVASTISNTLNDLTEQLPDPAFLDLTHAVDMSNAYWLNPTSFNLNPVSMFMIESSPLEQASSHPASQPHSVARGTDSHGDGNFLPCKQQDLHQPSDSEVPELDCVTAAIEILRRLQGISNPTSTFPPPRLGELGGSQIHSRNPSGEDALDPNTNHVQRQLQTTLSATSRLSTILVCPCSQKRHVAILVATVCLAILEFYDSLFQNPHPHFHLQFQDNQAMEPIFPLLASLGMDKDMMGIDTDVNRARTQPQTSAVQVLDELSTLANLIMQFCGKYKGAQQTQSENPLSTIADTLKLRLRMVASRAFHSGSIEGGRLI